MTLAILKITLVFEWLCWEWLASADRWDDALYSEGTVLYRKLADARVHLSGWPRLREYLTRGPQFHFHDEWHPDGRGPRVLVGCDHCGVSPFDGCDAGLHS